MGYDLHVTRKKFWADEEGPEISPSEWLTVIANDPELNMYEVNGLNVNGPYFAVWTGPGEYECWIDYAHGQLFSKYPTPEFTEKMVQLAKLLGGKVQGDDGEIYPGNGQEPYEEEG